MTRLVELCGELINLDYVMRILPADDGSKCWIVFSSKASIYDGGKYHVRYNISYEGAKRMIA